MLSLQDVLCYMNKTLGTSENPTGFGLNLLYVGKYRCLLKTKESCRTETGHEQLWDQKKVIQCSGFEDTQIHKSILMAISTA